MHFIILLFLWTNYNYDKFFLFWYKSPLELKKLICKIYILFFNVDDFNWELLFLIDQKTFPITNIENVFFIYSTICILPELTGRLYSKGVFTNISFDKIPSEFSEMILTCRLLKYLEENKVENYLPISKDLDSFLNEIAEESNQFIPFIQDFFFNDQSKEIEKIFGLTFSDFLEKSEKEISYFLDLFKKDPKNKKFLYLQIYTFNKEEEKVPIKPFKFPLDKLPEDEQMLDNIIDDFFKK